MHDNLKRRQPEDPNKVNLNQPWEVEYWKVELNVSEQVLRSTIQKVGPLVKDIKRALNK
jgi:hypothetical protein